MPLIQLDDIHLAFGAEPLLEGAALAIEPGERLGLIGRNGAGKTTLMRLLGGEITPDDGEIRRRDTLRLAWLPQEIPESLAGRVEDIVAEGLGATGRLLAAWHALSQAVAEDPARLPELEALQHRLDAEGGWQREQRVRETLSRLMLDGDEEFSTLSGGLKRRALLARALVSNPDLLLLDEPTNHLDIEAIEWLERFLLQWPGAVVFVTHDRAFLDAVATGIVELDRGRLTRWPAPWAEYLRRKEEALEAEARQQAEFDRRLAREEAWIRQGIKARRTRNEGRVRALEAMREARRRRRERPGAARLELNEAERSGKIVIEAEGVVFAHGERTIVRDFSTRILRGDRVGIIGPNGVGKTTLIRLLLGELSPQAGRIRRGTKLEVAWFDQLRETLDPARSVLDNLAGGRDRITINGRSRHVMSYLQDFLFTPARVRSPVSSLSGGERARLLLARLFTRPFNLLVMDEPTNDLDMETLELLEEKLLEYEGTLLLVSHDRHFLDNVVTSTLVFESEGRVAEYVGGYTDWLRQRPGKARQEKPAPSRKAAPSSQSRSRPVRKLNYRERRELETLPATIERLEKEIAGLHERMSEPDFYRQDGARIAEARERLAALEQELETCFARWETLEARAAEMESGSRP